MKKKPSSDCDKNNSSRSFVVSCAISKRAEYRGGYRGGAVQFMSTLIVDARGSDSFSVTRKRLPTVP